MHWKTKAHLFRLFDALPFGGHLHYAALRYVTRSLPRPIPPLEQTGADFIEHMRRIRPYLPDPASHDLFEFGVGWDLFSNLIFYCYGIGRQFCWDLQRLARPALVNHCIAELRRVPPPGAARVPEHAIGADLAGDLERHYGIVYRAPADARQTGLPAGSISVVTSTNTLEHIPEPDIRAILRESRRILRGDGLFSVRVDYTDHYHYGDARITPYNFLAYPDDAWQRYNPSRHFQNRLRHSDYQRLFREAGWRIDEESALTPDGGADSLSDVALAPCFQRYDRADLAVRTGWYTLRQDTA